MERAKEIVSTSTFYAVYERRYRFSFVIYSRFDFSSTIKIAIYRQRFIGKVPGTRKMVAEFNGKGVDLLDNINSEVIKSSCDR